MSRPIKQAPGSYVAGVDAILDFKLRYVGITTLRHGPSSPEQGLYAANRRQSTLPIGTLLGSRTSPRRGRIGFVTARRHGDAPASMQTLPEQLRHLSVHRGHNLKITNQHGELIDTSRAKQMTFSGSRAELLARLAQLESAGATGVIFGTSGVDVGRALHAFASLVGLRGNG